MGERSRIGNSLQEYNPFLNEQPSEANFEKVIRGDFMRGLDEEVAKKEELGWAGGSLWR